MNLSEEAAIQPKLEELIEVYAAAMRMADAQDHMRDMRELSRRQGFLMAYLALIRPLKQDTTQPLF